jgi:hypothetical protein
MKHWTIELQKVRSMANAQGLIRAQIEALVQPAGGRDDTGAGTVLTFTEETARVLVLLLKAQLAEFDARKAKSRR